MSLILGSPFLSTAGATIHVGDGEIHFNINGKKERFSFQAKKEQCSEIKACTTDTPRIDPSPQNEDSLLTVMKKCIKGVKF